MRDHPPAGGATAGTSPPWERTPTGLRSQWRLDCDFRSVTDLRWWLRAMLGQTWGLSVGGLEDLVLAACEAANNAVQHPQMPQEPFFDVSTEIDVGTVTIVVRDHGTWRPPVPPGDQGRGLSLMHALADTTVTASGSGTTVTIRRHPEGHLTPVTS